MKIAFWGGCINRQQNMAPEKHYHALVRKAMIQQTGIEPKTWLRFYSSFREMHTDTLRFLNEGMHYDYLVIFLRPYTLMPLTKPLIRYTDKTMGNRIALHPRFSKTKYYHHMVKEYKVVTRSNSEEGAIHKVFQRMNDFAGDLMGLQQWARKEVMNILAEIQANAVQKGTKLILLGPPPYPSNRRIDNCCVELNKQITRLASANNLVHVDMTAGFDKDGRSFSEPDGKHVSEAGHAFMAQGIIENLQLHFEQTATQMVG